MIELTKEALQDPWLPVFTAKDQNDEGKYVLSVSNLLHPSELLIEGFINEFARGINVIRKNLGFKVEDHVVLWYSIETPEGAYEPEIAIQKWRKHLCDRCGLYSQFYAVPPGTTEHKITWKKKDFTIAEVVVGVTLKLIKMTDKVKAADKLYDLRQTTVLQLQRMYRALAAIHAERDCYGDDWFTVLAEGPLDKIKHLESELAALTKQLSK